MAFTRRGLFLRILVSGNQVSHLGFDEATEDTDPSRKGLYRIPEQARVIASWRRPRVSGVMEVRMARFKTLHRTRRAGLFIWVRLSERLSLERSLGQKLT